MRMPTRLANKQRIGKDRLMMSVSLMALVGSTFVVLSFAAKPEPTQRVGTVFAKDLKTSVMDGRTTIGFPVATGLRYCLRYTPAETATLQVSGRDPVVIVYDVQDGACFMPVSSEPVTITIEGNEVQINRLTVVSTN